jgi:flavin-dependent dehydrogenase
MMRPCLGLEDVGDTVLDVIILGAGPAGTIAAHQLATSGARTLLVDKRLFPRGKVCGACLNAAALGVLKSVGLDGHLCGLGGIRLDGLELRFAGRSARLNLPGGIALSRERLDVALVDLAVASGAVFLPQTEGLVGPIQADARRVALVQVDRAVTVRARVVLVATGLGQVRFEGESPVKSRSTTRSRIGAGCMVDSFPDVYRQGTVFMTVGRNGYVGLVRVEDGQLNVAAAFNKNHVKDSGSPGAAANRILLEAART